MKWTRESKGRYVSGDWRISGAGGRWELYRNTKSIGVAASKKDLQKYAADKDGELEPELERKAASRAAPSLDSVLASLSLQIDHLATRIDALTAAIHELKR